MLLNLLLSVTSITERLILSLLAVAEPDLLGLRGNVLYGPALHDLLKEQVLTGEITEWLFSPCHPTPTPVVCASCFYSHFVWPVIIYVPIFRGWSIHARHLTHRVHEFGSVSRGGLVLPPPGGIHGGGVERLDTHTDRNRGGKTAQSWQHFLSKFHNKKVRYDDY